MKTFLSKYLLAFFISVSAFLIPIKPYLVVVGLAIALDVVIAVAVAIKINGKEGFQSKRLKDTISKSAIYFGALVLARGIEIAFTVDFVMKVVAGIMLATELRSIDEKYYKLYKKSLFGWVIDRLPNMNKEKNKYDEK
jgi:hypothetical protein